MRQAGRAGHGALRLGYIGALLGIIVMVGVMPPLSTVRAATLTVTTCASSGAGSLPAVFAAAAANDTITFAQDCTGVNAITLTATLTPTVNVIIDATTPLHAVTIDGGKNVRLFLVNSGLTLGLRGLTLINGLGGFRGGAIRNLGGTINVAGCAFSANYAGFGGAINTIGGTVNIAGSAFSNNRAGFSGGAIDVEGGGR